jgi:hypothetical protein
LVYARKIMGQGLTGITESERPSEE